jgi:hypothetical protein
MTPTTHSPEKIEQLEDMIERNIKLWWQYLNTANELSITYASRVQRGYKVYKKWTGKEYTPIAYRGQEE